MPDVPQERWGADAPPLGEAMSPVCFAGLVFDLGACRLARKSGEAIPLTRGEFRLLRLFVSRPGRVLSRDVILEAVANRPLELFDRSVDALVVRLRRKIEPDPKTPRFIVTVPGEGYRFDGFAQAVRGAPADGAVGSDIQVGANPSRMAARPADPSLPNGASPPPSAARERAPTRSWRGLAAAAALVVALFAVGAYGWRSGLAPRFTGTVVEDKLANAPRLSIVVLPFENMSGDKEQDYFADGITDDLTTDLSHLRDSFVIERGTAFTFKGKPVDAKQIGRELGVRYVLEGSVRRLGEKVEVNAELVSTETGAHVWAERFEGERSKLGELQVEVVSRLANSLGVELVKAEALRSMRERPNNPDAVDFVMRARAKGGDAFVSSKSMNIDRIELYERGLALDPQNEPAMVGLSFALNNRVNALWSEDQAGDAARAETLADTALALQPDDTLAHNAKAMVFFIKRQWKAAISQAAAALADDPSNASAHANSSFWNMFLGHSEDGFVGVETALRLSPRDPEVHSWQFYMCHLHTHLAQWEQAIEWCGKSIASGDTSMFPYVDLAAANAWAGHDKEAKEAVAELRKLYPDFTVQTWAGIPWSDDPTFKAQYQRIVEGLRKAGLPEGEVKKE